MRSLLVLAVACSTLTPAQMPAAAAADTARADKQGVNWLSFLVPKAFQKNPRVAFNVITEMTDVGRAAPPPSPERPQLYVLHSSGYMRLGQGAPARETSPPPEHLMAGMREALAANGYREVTGDGSVPELVVVYYWGSYSSAGVDGEATNNELSQQAANPESPAPPRLNAETSTTLLPLVLSDLAKRKELLEKASLVGGVKFAAELQKVLNEEVEFEDIRANEQRLADFMASNGGGSAVGPALGGATNAQISMAFNSFNPFHRFKTRDARTEYLVEQSFRSFYFVVASAYTYESVARNDRRLLWRTKMTVDSNGVAMAETLPRLIADAAPYFGREMDATVTVARRIDREGSVEVGTPTVVEVLDSTATPTTDHGNQPAPATETDP